jgi:class 3 adenylate cyclase
VLGLQFYAIRVAVCERCGLENPAGFDFCGLCGTQLVADDHPSSRERRKTVTVVFADVADSTALAERLDPEAMRRVMSRYFEEMRACLERHGGTVEKFIGDAVMAVFGVPAVREDDPLRALRASARCRNGLTTSTQWTANGLLLSSDTPAATPRVSRGVGPDPPAGGYQPADIIFFGHDDGPSGHSALWLGNGQIVQCSSSGGGSNIRPLAGYVAPTGWVRWAFAAGR